jgi:hypothetical protein
MAKRGRTPSYTPDYCTIAYKFCLLGATNEDLAELFEVSRNTIGNWLTRYPEFKKAMQDGRDVADADVAPPDNRETLIGLAQVLGTLSSPSCRQSSSRC